jgi:hypothetical protein
VAELAANIVDDRFLIKQKIPANPSLRNKMVLREYGTISRHFQRCLFRISEVLFHFTAPLVWVVRPDFGLRAAAGI